jgi:hypothetical protein
MITIKNYIANKICKSKLIMLHDLYTNVSEKLNPSQGHKATYPVTLTYSHPPGTNPKHSISTRISLISNLKYKDLAVQRFLINTLRCRVYP